MNVNWTPATWREKEIDQGVIYPDLTKLQQTENELSKFPPLIFAGEVNELKQKLANVALGKAFLLQGGDCAESFSEHSAENIREYLKVFLQMSVVLTFAGKCPVVKVGRIAGQFAKPRTLKTELQGDIELPSYRGDIINSIDFNTQARTPDPERMIMAYRQSAATLNLLRAFTQGGFADLEMIQKWTSGLVNNKTGYKYFKIINHIKTAIAFMNSLGVNTTSHPQLKKTDFYTCHEALLLNYEEALTRKDSISKNWYSTSAHFLWIGARTRDISKAHIEYLRGVENPIGIKCDLKTDATELLQLIKILNPKNEVGKITLITRFGSEHIETKLTELINIIKKSEISVVWICDPMHANTLISSTGYKTRELSKIIAETTSFFKIHNKHGSYAGGLHLEMTGKNVTECTGGDIAMVYEEDLSLRYHTHCDPRLNSDQSLELAFRVAALLAQG